MKAPIRVAVTGPAGQIGYSILFRIASGALFGPDQPVILNLLERNNAASLEKLKGVMMELDDCAFPLLHDMKSTGTPTEAFRDVDYAFLIGARPRTLGMQRSELLQANAEIFRTQGKALDQAASRNVKVLVVGNPANTNAYIAMRSAPSLSPTCFSSMVRLDQNRATSLLARKVGAAVTEVQKVAIWGNHSATMYADVNQATVKGDFALSLVPRDWVESEFIPTVAHRGSAIIKARGASSAASAASAALDHMRDWALGSNGRWVSMGVPSDGAYGIPEGIVFGFPCICRDGRYEIVRDVEMSESSKARIAKTLAELESERKAIDNFISW